MSYIYLTLNAALLDYQEYPMCRVESWVYGDRIYECIWFWPNDAAIPNSITYKDLK